MVSLMLGIRICSKALIHFAQGNQKGLFDPAKIVADGLGHCTRYQVLSRHISTRSHGTNDLETPGEHK